MSAHHHCTSERDILRVVSDRGFHNFNPRVSDLPFTKTLYKSRIFILSYICVCCLIFEHLSILLLVGHKLSRNYLLEQCLSIPSSHAFQQKPDDLLEENIRRGRGLNLFLQREKHDVFVDSPLVDYIQLYEVLREIN